MTTPPLSVAPMMERTDRHFRWLLRQITRSTLLYTEMVHARAILNGPRDRLLAFDPIEHPIALQLGGDDPAHLAMAARIAVEEHGYDEVNLNVGCPSERVSSGNFGACLMRSPEVVAEAVAAMRAAVSVPVTVKHRIGVDELDRYEDMLHFVDVVAAAGCARFSVHARKAWLKGLSPKENRTVPPLRYPEVWRLKAERPSLQIEVNGGITTLDEAAVHLEHVDAVMIGRAFWDDPMRFAEADRRFFGSEALTPTHCEVAAAFLDYAERQVGLGERYVPVIRGALNLFTGLQGTRRWKRALSTGGVAGLAAARATLGGEVDAD